MKTKVSAEEIRNDLRQFTGSEQLHKNWLGLKFTDGIKYLVDAAQAYWLLDVIGSHLCTKKNLRGVPFLVARLVVKDSKAVFTMHTDWSDENPEKFPAVCRQRIPYTDFPLDEIKLYCIRGTVMLPSEY